MKLRNIAAVALLFPTLALAQDGFSGNRLLAACEQGEILISTPDGTPTNANMREASICLGYIVGFRDGIEIGEQPASGLPGKKLYCEPPNVTHRQVMRVAVKWLRANPQRLHEPGAVLLAFALRDAFPCK